MEVLSTGRRMPDKFPTLAKPDPSYHGAIFADVAGSAAFVTRIRAVILRDTGATISPFNAFILLQGLETLSLRVERHVANALKVVDYLSKHPKVEKVNHPSLPTHPDHELYNKYFPNGAGSIFTFEIKGGQEAAWKFIRLTGDIFPTSECRRCKRALSFIHTRHSFPDEPGRTCPTAHNTIHRTLEHRNRIYR